MKHQSSTSAPGDTNLAAKLKGQRQGHHGDISREGKTHCLVAWRPLGGMDVGLAGTETLIFLGSGKVLLSRWQLRAPLAMCLVVWEVICVCTLPAGPVLPLAQCRPQPSAPPNRSVPRIPTPTPGGQKAAVGSAQPQAGALLSPPCQWTGCPSGRTGTPPARPGRGRAPAPTARARCPGWTGRC